MLFSRLIEAAIMACGKFTLPPLGDNFVPRGSNTVQGKTVVVVGATTGFGEVALAVLAQTRCKF
jgi:hypothetical protein